MKEPLSSVINAEAMSAYLRLFGLLWSLKRAEHTLNRVWQVMAAIQRQLNVIQGLKSEYGLHCPGIDSTFSLIAPRLLRCLSTVLLTRMCTPLFAFKNCVCVTVSDLAVKHQPG